MSAPPASLRGLRRALAVLAGDLAAWSAVAVYAAVVLVATYQHWHRPMANWDALPYAALALRLDGVGDGQLRTAALAEVRAAFPERFDDFVSGGSDALYRQTVATDDAAFLAQLPFYVTKPLYVAGVFLLGRLEGNFATSTAHLSALAFLVFCLLAALARPSGVPRAPWLAGLVLVSCFSATFPLSLLAAASSPDVLSAVFLLAGVLLGRDGRWGTAAVFLLLAQLARPDAIIPVLTLVLAWAGVNPRHRLRLLAIAGLSIGLSQAVGMLADGYPLGVLLSTLVARQPYPGTMTLALGSPEHMQILMRYLGDLLVNVRFPLLGLAGLFALAWSVYKRARWPAVLSFTALANIAAHVVLFPEVGGYQERFFFISYLFILMATGTLWREAYAAMQAKSGTSN